MENKYTTLDRLNEILDKILDYGIKTLTLSENDFLNSWSLNLEEEFHSQLLLEEENSIFENTFFRFELSDKIEFDDEIHYNGIIYVPDLILNNGKSIKGRIKGSIIVYKDGDSDIEFETEGYDILEFCSGIEYELDQFIDYIVSKLS